MVGATPFTGRDGVASPAFQHREVIFWSFFRLPPSARDLIRGLRPFPRAREGTQTRGLNNSTRTLERTCFSRSLLLRPANRSLQNCAISCATRRESELLETPSVSNAAQAGENTRKSSFLDYISRSTLRKPRGAKQTEKHGSDSLLFGARVVGSSRKCCSGWVLLGS